MKGHHINVNVSGWSIGWLKEGINQPNGWYVHECMIEVSGPSSERMASQVIRICCEELNQPISQPVSQRMNYWDKFGSEVKLKHGTVHKSQCRFPKHLILGSISGASFRPLSQAKKTRGLFFSSRTARGTEPQSVLATFGITGKIAKLANQPSKTSKQKHRQEEPHFFFLTKSACSSEPQSELPGWKTWKQQTGKKTKQTPPQTTRKPETTQQTTVVVRMQWTLQLWDQLTHQNFHLISQGSSCPTCVINTASANGQRRSATMVTWQ